MKKKNVEIYLGCIVLGVLIGYFVIELKHAESDIQKVEVKVDIPKPVVLRDTIINTEFKYIYKDRCCCEFCIKDTTK